MIHYLLNSYNKCSMSIKTSAIFNLDTDNLIILFKNELDYC